MNKIRFVVAAVAIAAGAMALSGTAAAQSSFPTGSAGPSGVYYENCSAARAAGAAPLYRGEPGYAPKLDRDDDGIACE